MNKCKSCFLLPTIFLFSFSVANANQNETMDDKYLSSFKQNFIADFKQNCIESAMSQGIPERKRAKIESWCDCMASNAEERITPQNIFQLSTDREYQTKFALTLMQEVGSQCR